MEYFDDSMLRLTYETEVSEKNVMNMKKKIILETFDQTIKDIVIDGGFTALLRRPMGVLALNSSYFTKNELVLLYYFIGTCTKDNCIDVNPINLHRILNIDSKSIRAAIRKLEEKGIIYTKNELGYIQLSKQKFLLNKQIATRRNINNTSFKECPPLVYNPGNKDIQLEISNKRNAIIARFTEVYEKQMINGECHKEVTTYEVRTIDELNEILIKGGFVTVMREQFKMLALYSDRFNKTEYVLLSFFLSTCNKENIVETNQSFLSKYLKLGRNNVNRAMQNLYGRHFIDKFASTNKESRLTFERSDLYISPAELNKRIASCLPIREIKQINYGTIPQIDYEIKKIKNGEQNEYTPNGLTRIDNMFQDYDTLVEKFENEANTDIQ